MPGVLCSRAVLFAAIGRTFSTTASLNTLVVVVLDQRPRLLISLRGFGVPPSLVLTLVVAQPTMSFAIYALTLALSSTR